MPRPPRRLVVAACAVALLAPAAVAAVDGTAEDPMQLWEEYPLREGPGPAAPGGEGPSGGEGASGGAGASGGEDAQGPQGSAGAGSGARDAGAPAGEDGLPPFAALAAGAALLAALGAVAVALLRRRRRRGGGGPAEPAARPAGASGSTARPAGASDPTAPPAGASGPPAPAAAPVPVFGYLHAPGEDDLPAVAQRLRAACARRGWTMRHLVWDAAGSPGRPWLSWVVGRIAAGEASGVVVARLDDLGPTEPARQAVLDRLAQLGAPVLAVDDGFETSSPRFARSGAGTGAVKEEIAR